MNNTTKITGRDYLYLALYAFGGIGLELVIAFIEPFIYGHAADYNDWTIIAHWIITCLVWGCCALFLLKLAKKNFQLEMHTNKTIKPWQWIVVIILLILSLMLSFISWDGFKVQQEFINLGLLNFIFQYLYYFFESVLITLIIVFAQKAFEIWFKKDNIPYGCIFCGITWGLAHIFTKTSLEVGLLSVILGFGFGAVYLLLNRDIRKTIPIIFLMFII